MIALVWCILCVFVTKSQSNSERNCNETIQCANQNIKVNGRLNCQGYLGCAKSILNATDIWCSGDQACRESPNMFGAQGLRCTGKSACYGSKRVASLGQTQCTGAYGCAWISQLISVTFGVICDGHYSCLHSNITASGVVVGGGRNALTNAIIDSTNAIIWFLGIPGMVVELSGRSASSGLKMICRANDTCGLICIAAGCQGLALNCEPGSLCITEPRSCITQPGALIGGVYCPRSISYDGLITTMTDELFSNITQGFATFKTNNNIDSIDPTVAVFTEIDDNLLVKSTTDDSDDDDSDDDDSRRKGGYRSYRRRYSRYWKGRRYGYRGYRGYRSRRRYYSKYYW